MTKAQEIVEAALAILARPAGWTKNTAWRTSTGLQTFESDKAESCCILGALYLAALRAEEWQAGRRLTGIPTEEACEPLRESRVLVAEILDPDETNNHAWIIQRWNDQPYRKQYEVIEVLAKAAGLNARPADGVDA